MHSLYMQIASLSNIAGKTKWLINHGFYIFFQCSKHLSWNKGFKEKMPRKLYVYVCTRYMVPHVFSRREDLSGSNRTLQWNSKTLRGHKRWGDVIKIDRQHLATCSDHHPTPFTPVLGSVNMPRSQKSSKETSFHVLKKAN